MPQIPLEDERNPVEVLAEDFLERHRRGETPSIDEYTGAHPAHAAEIRALFPTMLAMERLKLSRESSRGGQASLGPHKLQRLGDFELVRELGRGGMGVVFEAEQKSLGRRVAVKVLPRQQLMHERQLARFEREARMAAGLHHTNIVPIFGTGEQDGFHYYVMQYISGLGLDDVVRELRKGEPARSPLLTPLIREGDGKNALAHAIARVGLQAARALAHAHEQHVLHRDIKPGNLLLDAHGTLWVTDFGLAKALEEHEMTRTGDVVGTLAYMAPEQFRGQYDERTDIYGLGLTLYELLTLHAAYRESDRSQLIHAITTRDPEHPRKYGVQMPEDLVTIVMKCVARDPKHRYASAAGLREDLEAFLDGRPISARPVSLFERTWRWAGRNRAMAALTVSTVVLFFVASIGGWVAFARTDAALSGEQEAKQLAERNLEVTLGALAEVFASIGATGARIASFEDGVDGGEDGANGASDAILEPLAQPTVSASEAALLARILERFEELAELNSENRRVQDVRARAYRSIGDIQQRLLNWDAALIAYGRAGQLYRELEGIDAAERGAALAAVLNEVGRVHAAKGSFAESRKSHGEALELLDPLTLSTDSPRVRYEFVRTMNFLGEGFTRGRGRSFLSPADYERLQRMREEREAQAPRPRPPEREASEAPDGDERPRPRPRGDRGRSMDRFRELRERARQYVDLLLRLDPRSDVYRLAGAKACFLFAWMSSRRGEFDVATRELQKSLGYFEQLVREHPQADYYKFEWAEALVESSGLHAAEAEIRQIQDGIALHNDLVATRGANPLYRAARADAHTQLATAQRRAGHGGEAVESADRALKHWIELTELHPDVPAYRHGMHRALRDLAELLADNGQADKATSMMREILSATPLDPWSEELTLTVDQRNDRLTRTTNLWFLAQLLEQAGQDEEAAQLRSEGLALWPEGSRAGIAEFFRRMRR